MYFTLADLIHVVLFLLRKAFISMLPDFVYFG